MLNTFEIPSRIKSLKYSYGLTVTIRQATAASRLRISQFRPGVYLVGASIVDLWRMSCSCQQSRRQKIKGIAPAVKPCPHFLALHLAHEFVLSDTDPVLYLKRMGIQQPKIHAVYCSLRYLPGLYRIECSQYGDDRRHVIPITPNADTEISDVPTSNIIKLVPFYR